MAQVKWFSRWLRMQTSIEKWTEEEDELLLNAIKKPLGCGEEVVELGNIYEEVGHIFVPLHKKSV